MRVRKDFTYEVLPEMHCNWSFSVESSYQNHRYTTAGGGVGGCFKVQLYAHCLPPNRSERWPGTLVSNKHQFSLMWRVHGLHLLKIRAHLNFLKLFIMEIFEQTLKMRAK